MSGTYQNIPVNATTTRSVQNGARGVCTDIVGNPTGVNELDLSKRFCAFPGLDGVKVDPLSGNIVRIMSNFPLGYHLDSPDPRSAFPALTSIEKNNLSWSLLAKANPSAPEISVPTFIAELKDIPSLMKSWYGLFAVGWKDRRARFNGGTHIPSAWLKLFDRAPELLASGHLTWRWAVRPFIKDLLTLATFTDIVQSRVRMLKKLQTDRSIRRRVAIRKDSKQIVTDRILHSEGIIIKGTTTDLFTEELWGTVKYQMLVPPEIPLDHIVLKDDTQIRQLAMRLKYGLTSYELLSTTWELMPWSWLVDWFTGLGTVIAATNNTLGLFHKNACLMRHTVCNTRISINDSLSEGWARPNAAYQTSYERKERFPASTVLPFAPSYLPLLTRKAGLILGSLLILKVRSRDPLASNLYRLLNNRL